MELNPSRQICFCGPTISQAEIASILPDCIYLPPAAQGDLANALFEYQPSATLLIDGYYENIPSVWHKEILFALSNGCLVVGAASMGALRASELHTFGMKGIGRIFELYASGVLEDDDEVAVLHGPKEVGYKPVTEALVNIRDTLQKACNENFIDPLSEACLLNVAKSLFYKKRTWRNIVELGLGLSHTQSERESVLSLLKNNVVNTKATDAIEAAKYLRSITRTAIPKFEAKFSFSSTDYFLTMLQNQGGHNENT